MKTLSLVRNYTARGLLAHPSVAALLAFERSCFAGALFDDGILSGLFAALFLAAQGGYLGEVSMGPLVVAAGTLGHVLPGWGDNEAVDHGPSLYVSFFGGFEVYSRGEVLALGNNSKAGAIFKCLLARRGRPVSQDVLMDWLWPESGVKKARWSLNSAVYALRRALDRSQAPLLGEAVILERGQYRISPNVRVLSDVEEFDARYESGRLLEKAGRVPEAAAEYEAAIKLYKGDYLAEDLYEDWTTIERERLINAYVDMLDRLAGYYTSTGQFQKSIDSRYRLLEKDQYHEESYRSLMICYDQLGLRGRALHQYELCERALSNLYGSSPAPETKTLYEQLGGRP